MGRESSHNRACGRAQALQPQAISQKHPWESGCGGSVCVLTRTARIIGWTSLKTRALFQETTFGGLFVYVHSLLTLSSTYGWEWNLCP